MGYRSRRRRRKDNTRQRLAAIVVTLGIAIITGGVGSFGGCAGLAHLLPDTLPQRLSNAASVSSLGDILSYGGNPIVYIGADATHPQGTPAFTSEEVSRAQSSSFTEFSRLDYLGRCGAALACLGQETLPIKPRENISLVNPSGWDQRTHIHVLYCVTPLFEEGELVAHGVHMEAYSLEDDGAGLSFNVYCYNNQPGVVIDYVTGASHAS